MPKMPKIMVSLRSVFNMDDRCLAYVNPEIRKIKYYPTMYFLKIDRIPQLEAF